MMSNCKFYLAGCCTRKSCVKTKSLNWKVCWPMSNSVCGFTTPKKLKSKQKVYTGNYAGQCLIQFADSPPPRNLSQNKKFELEGMLANFLISLRIHHPQET